MASKEQERQAIVKVKKIVESMGENSYLGTAMEGVLETAEENIEFDAAFSMKGRAELAEKEASELKAENEGLRKSLAEMTERFERADARCNEAYGNLERYTIPRWMMYELGKMIENGIKRAEREIKEAADEMAEAIGEGGQMSAQAEEQAKRYKEQRSERNILNQMKEFLARYRGETQEK